MPKGDKFKEFLEALAKQKGGGESALMKLIVFLVYFVVITVGLIVIGGKGILSLWTLVSVVVGLIAAYYLYQQSLPIGILGASGIIVGVAIGLTVLPGTLSAIEGKSGVKVGDMWESVKCVFGSFGDPTKGFSGCPTLIGGTKAPEAMKEGGYRAIDVRLGTKSGEYNVPELYGSRNTLNQYIFSVEVENPDEENSVSGFSLSGSIFNETKGDEGIIFKLSPNICSENCVIKPKESKSIVMTSGESAYCKKSRCGYLNLKVTSRYSYSGEGKTDFVLVASEKNLTVAPEITPTKSAGPLDVVVYFTPENYVFGLTTLDKVYMFISLTNKENGKAVINKIDISPTATIIGPYKCYNPFNEEFTSGDITSPLHKRTVSKEQLYKCIYDVSELKNKKLDSEPYKNIPITITVNYVYEEDHPSKSGRRINVNWITS